MPRVVEFAELAPMPGEYSLITSDLPGRGNNTIGVLLLDSANDTLHLRLRRDWEQWANREDAEVLSELESDLAEQSRDRGGKSVLRQLSDEASNSIRITDLEAVTVRDFRRTLNDLYREHVSTEVLAFRTHLPLYSLSVAAGPFLTNPENITADEWIEVPQDLKLDGNMFIAHISGRSMEPSIPNGSLCVFRRDVIGSRNGRLVLVRNSELADDNQYTVKRYHSEKTARGDFHQTRIWLESLNPDFPSWDLDKDADKYQVIAEFVRVLD